jgi:alpha-tubulin suppressor-like RCC1 family protein
MPKIHPTSLRSPQASVGTGRTPGWGLESANAISGPTIAHCTTVKALSINRWSGTELITFWATTAREVFSPRRFVGTDGKVELERGALARARQAAAVVDVPGLGARRSAYCWGENEGGIVGDGTRIDRFVPTRVLSDVRSIVTGRRTCAVLNSGAVNCWGDGQGGLGDGTRNSSAVPIATQPIAGSAIDIEGLGHFNCVLLDQGGAVSCWGLLGTTENAYSVPTTIPEFADVVDLAASDGHVCGVLSNGTIACLGSNSNGQLGDGTFGNSSAVPVQVRGINSARQVTANQSWTCALLVDGRVQCWGRNRDLGDGVTTDSSSPVTVQGLNDAIQVSAGLYHACAVRGDGTIYCWGDSGAGRDSAIYGSLRDVQSVHCGYIHTCALLNDGSAYCWGAAVAGLGGGPEARPIAPVRVWGP